MDNRNKDNYSDNYERLRRKIEDASKNIRYWYIKGPKGEKGDSGVANISIGNVETVSPDEEAEVINVGTDENVILDFKIPRGQDGQEGKSGSTGPQGEQGQEGKIGPTGPKGDKGEIGPTGPKGDIGPTGSPGQQGISEKIVIDDTLTLEATEEADVVDQIEDNTHHLTFYIPKGETGPKGDTGAGAGATSFNAIIFAGYNDATDSRPLTIKEKIFIPESTPVFTVPTVINIEVKTTGIYEITLCGKISGVTDINGGKFFLINTTTGTVINNLTFELKEGTTTDMTFSGTTTTQIFAPANFQVKTSIINDPSTSNIKFYDINLVMKRYNI